MLGAAVAANGPRTHYMRARLRRGDGVPVITPFDRQDSALLTILTEANALLIRPVSDGARRGGRSGGLSAVLTEFAKRLTQTGNTGRTLHQHGVV